MPWGRVSKKQLLEGVVTEKFTNIPLELSQSFRFAVLIEASHLGLSKDELYAKIIRDFAEKVCHPDGVKRMMEEDRVLFEKDRAKLKEQELSKG